MDDAAAYPTTWGSSGVMTFLVNQEGRICESVGARAAELAGAMTEYHPDLTWTLARDKGESGLAGTGRRAS